MDFIQAGSEEQKKWEVVFDRCREDETFKNELIANPIQAIESLAGQPMNLHGLKLVVTDQSDSSTIYVNIPPDSESLELTEGQLELIAGGDCLFLSTVGNVNVGGGNGSGNTVKVRN